MRHRRTRLVTAVTAAVALQTLSPCHNAPDSVKRICEQVAADPERTRGMRAVVQLILKGDGGGNYYVALDGGTCAIHEGQHAAASTTLELTAKDFAEASECEVGGRLLFMEDKMKMEGDLGLMLQFFGLLNCSPAADQAAPADSEVRIIPPAEDPYMVEYAGPPRPPSPTGGAGFSEEDL